MKDKPTIYLRLKKCFVTAIPAALRSARFLLSIMIPVSLAVTLLHYAGVIRIIASYLDPMFRITGLPGDAAIVFITSICLNIYSAIAVISTIPFTGRELTILALMCLISHSYFIETPIQSRTGSSPLKMISIRFIYSFIGGIALNFFMPQGSGEAVTAAASSAAGSGLTDILSVWAANSLLLIFEILILLSLLMIMQRILEEFGIIKWMSEIFSPVMKVLGLPESVTFLWIVAYTLGLAYGSAIMIEESEKGTLEKGDADLLNHHIAISHSILEDTLLFVAIGVNAGWIIFPRIILSVFEVWILRLRRAITFREGPVIEA
ncbi:MAG TPA: nucleoside recognition protein [Spirochaetota bacterium]|nr:nucleoside recognition protein [Spirochaetota bacterium]HPJ34318.1 nucleoside recognition protein [Spirochaetota bacterium]